MTATWKIVCHGIGFKNGLVSKIGLVSKNGLVSKKFPYICFCKVSL